MLAVGGVSLGGCYDFALFYQSPDAGSDQGAIADRPPPVDRPLGESAIADLATVDFAANDLPPGDLATPDLAMLDLAAPDLASPDQSAPPDLAMPSDLTAPPLDGNGDALCSHSNGFGGAYTDCKNPLGTPGDSATYNATMASEAAASWGGTSAGGLTCGVSHCIMRKGFGCGNVCVNTCALWCYDGDLAGYASEGFGGCACPTVGDPSTIDWN